MTLIVCAGKNEDFRFAKSIGVGLVEASAGLCELLFKFNAVASKNGGAKNRRGVASIMSEQSVASELSVANKPDKIIFIGTCGLYQKGVEKGLNALNLNENGKIKENLGAKNRAGENHAHRGHAHQHRGGNAQFLRHRVLF